MITGTKLQKMIILYAGKIHNYATLTEMGAGTGRHGSNHVRKRQACRKQNQTQKHDLTKKILRLLRVSLTANTSVSLQRSCGRLSQTHKSYMTEKCTADANQFIYKKLPHPSQSLPLSWSSHHTTNNKKSSLGTLRSKAAHQDYITIASLKKGGLLLSRIASQYHRRKRA